jgi:hypothetical protein
MDVLPSEVRVTDSTHGGGRTGVLVSWGDGPIVIAGSSTAVELGHSCEMLRRKRSHFPGC